MKKFIALTIGLSLLGSALIIPFSNASREAYHSYISQKVKRDGSYRHSTDYKGRYDRQLNNRTFVRKNRNFLGRSYSNSLLPKVGKRNLYQSKSNNPNLRLRTTTNRLFGSKYTNTGSHRLAISTNLNLAKEFNYETYSNELFSLEIPTESTTEAINNELNLVIPMSSMEISVKKLSQKCNKRFNLCARSIAMTLDRAEDLYRNSKSALQFQKTDSILGEMVLDKGKYVEGFIATKEGKNSFVARFIVEGKDGDMFLIETNSNLKDINTMVYIAKNLFQSFRAKY